MAVQQLIWIVLIGAVLIVGFPVRSPDNINEEDRLNYEKYVRQLEKKHKFAYNDIDQPWQPISDGDSAEDDSHEIVLKQNDFVSVQPLVKDEVKQVSESPVVVADETPVTPVVKAEDTPAVPITKAEEALVVAPVVEAEKEQQVADAISLIVTAVAEDEVATTTHEKLLADIEDIVPATTTNEKLLADIEDNVPATTTHEKLLGVADEVEGSGQSDPVVEQESVTISQPNEPVEDSTFSAFKTDLVEESVTKVADESDTNEGSGQLLSDSADEGSGQPLSDSADEGSGQPLKDFAGEGSGQPLADIPSSDEGSGAADTTEESGLAGELIKEIEHTIQPEISNEESSTGTHSDVHLKDDLAFDSLTTTESSTTDLVDEKEVKSTDTPTADDEVTQSEIQPSSTIKSTQAEDSTEVVLADSTDVVNDFQQVSTTASDSTDHPELATVINALVNDEILADEAILKNTTEKPDDSHSTPFDI